jgi:enamine deaminase RidA (YjgF/YER057c/UK114 family)
MGEQVWRLPFGRSHAISAKAGPLVFVGGAGDFDASGRIRSQGDLNAQIEGAMQNVAAALALEGADLADIVRLKAFYTADEDLDGHEVIGRLVAPVEADLLPAVTANPVPMQPFAGQTIQVQAIAQPGWREGPVRSVTRPAPAAYRGLFGDREITTGLRAGEFIAVPGQTGEEAGSDGIGQTHVVMQGLADTLDELGASLQDAIKKEGYYFGTTQEEWAAMASVRATYFKEPGPPATVVPCHRLWPESAQTKVEVLAFREEWNGFDKYIPRGDSWPKRVWDWPIPVPYRQGSRLRGTIWTGGQVPFEPGRNRGINVYSGDLLPQTRFTMSFIDDILRGFGAVSSDLALLVCYFASDGTPEATQRFMETVADCVAGPLPPITCVPQPLMHDANMTVEIWGVARG